MSLVILPVMLLSRSVQSSSPYRRKVCVPVLCLNRCSHMHGKGLAACGSVRERDFWINLLATCEDLLRYFLEMLHDYLLTKR